MRILWVKTGLPCPPDNGGRIRTYYTLRHLRQRHQITYVGLEDASSITSESRRRASEYCDELIIVPHHQLPPKGSPGLYAELVINLFSPLPHFIAKKRSQRMEQTVRSHLDERKHDLLVCDGLSASANLPSGPLPIPSILHQHNVEAMVWKRLADVQIRRPHRWYLRRQARKAAAYEAGACRRFDRVVALSPDDAAEMQLAYGVGPVSVLPLGVDLDYFRPNPAAPSPKPRSLVFTGSMNYLPNDDGMRWFLVRIWPTIHRASPETLLTIVGHSPTAALQQLAREAPGSVRVTGSVPDVRPYLQEAAVAIVPLRVGGGTRIKIFEALAMEKPVISTTIGAEGLPLEHGAHFLRADDEEEFAAAILKLFEDPAQADKLARQGAHLVRTAYGWETSGAAFEAICEEVAKRNTV